MQTNPACDASQWLQQHYGYFVSISTELKLLRQNLVANAARRSCHEKGTCQSGATVGLFSHFLALCFTAFQGGGHVWVILWKLTNQKGPFDNDMHAEWANLKTAHREGWRKKRGVSVVKRYMIKVIRLCTGMMQNPASNLIYSKASSDTKLHHHGLDNCQAQVNPFCATRHFCKTTSIPTLTMLRLQTPPPPH